MSTPRHPELVEVRFHAITAGGDAVGRTANAEGGKAVFAPFAAPGDVAEVAVTEAKRNFARGEIVRLLEAAPERVPPPCPYYRPQETGFSCGGCQIQHLSYTAQLAAKQRIVRDALERIGGFKGIEVEGCISSPEVFRYRNKADFVVGVQDERAAIGYFARESHHLIDITDCPLQCAENNAVLHAAREILAINPEWAFDARRGQGDLRRLVVRTSTQGQSVVTLVTNRSKWLYAGEFARQLRAAVPGIIGVLQRGPHSEGKPARTVTGQDWLVEVVNGLEFTVRGDGFFQVNRSLTPELVNTALRFAEVKAGQRALDLYCGVGLFALSLAQQEADVTGIEFSKSAIQDAASNAKAAGSSARFIAGDAARELTHFRAGEFELIVLDPPRAGAAEAVPGILRLGPQRVVYVSCDPATLARDAKLLHQGGYALKDVVPVDMFPQTGHVETVALFQKGNGSRLPQEHKPGG